MALRHKNTIENICALANFVNRIGYLKIYIYICVIRIIHNYHVYFFRVTMSSVFSDSVKMKQEEEDADIKIEIGKYSLGLVMNVKN